MTPANQISNIANPRVAVVSTFPPTECGIATFSQSLTNALNDEGYDASVIRLMRQDSSPSPDVVVHEHFSKQDLSDTQRALNGFDSVIFQHEFGIFNGYDGEEILEMMEALEIPSVAVLHTVLTQPTPHQRHVLNLVIERADAVVTMTESGRQKLVNGYSVNPKTLHVIAHGARPSSRTAHPSHRTVTNARPRILTWGLIGPGKGIEWMIDALGELKTVGLNPEYVIAGQTHPQVKIQQGESYRSSLIRRIQEHRLENDVHFIDRYLSSHDLEKLIATADIVVLPYDSVEQVTSGVLVEAVVAGKPIIATNFPHAEEMLSDGSGILVPQKDSHSIANGLRKILCNENEAAVIRRKLQTKSSSFLWSAIGHQYMQVIDNIVTQSASQPVEFVAS